MAGTGTAERFGDCNAEKTHFGKPLPQRLVIWRLAVEHLTHGLRRALFGEKLPRLVAHLFLFVGEIEVHGGLPFAVIPGRCEASNPESRCKKLLDSGFALRAPRND